MGTNIGAIEPSDSFVAPGSETGGNSMTTIRTRRRRDGSFLRPDGYEEYRRFRERPRTFETGDLPDEKIRAIARSRMDPRHAHLDEVLKAE